MESADRALDLEGWKTINLTESLIVDTTPGISMQDSPTSLLIFFWPMGFLFPTRSHAATCWAGVGF